MISVIIPVYNEENNLEPLFTRLVKVIKADKVNDYELIFVDDRSKDGSFSIIENMIYLLHNLCIYIAVKLFQSNLIQNLDTGGFQRVTHPCRI